MPIRTPPLYDAHERAGAKMTEFGGWDMPVHFGSIREEHAAVRESVGKFDVSHMGEVAVSGPDAGELMDRLVTADVRSLEPGRARYAMITDEEGVLLDDTVVYRAPDGDADYLFVPNAGHDAQMTERWETHREAWNLDAEVHNATTDLAMIAVQGPDAEDLVADVADAPDAVRGLSRFGHARVTVADADCLVSRTGYTGEDGFEVVPAWDEAERVWAALECPPCGLGARDTLRIEMGYLLSGQDFDPESNPRTPYEAGVGWTVDLDSTFVGRDALADATDPDEVLAGIRLTERGVPRHGYDVTDDADHIVGTVTSGTVSPTLDVPIALAYLPADLAAPGTDLRVVIRGERKRATTVETPFLEDH
jgi:aminomethyltransferase